MKTLQSFYVNVMTNAANKIISGIGNVLPSGRWYRFKLASKPILATTPAVNFRWFPHSAYPFVVIPLHISGRRGDSILITDDSPIIFPERIGGLEVLSPYDETQGYASPVSATCDFPPGSYSGLENGGTHMIGTTVFDVDIGDDKDPVPVSLPDRRTIIQALFSTLENDGNEYSVQGVNISAYDHLYVTTRAEGAGNTAEIRLDLPNSIVAAEHRLEIAFAFPEPSPLIGPMAQTAKFQTVLPQRFGVGYKNAGVVAYGIRGAK